MVRKMAYVGFSYLVGLFFASFFNSLTLIPLAVAAWLIAMLCHVFCKVGDKAKTAIVCIYFCVIGIIVYSAYYVFIHNNITKYDGYEVIISGEILDVNDYNSDKSLYIVKGKVNNDVEATLTCFYDTKSCKKGDKVIIHGNAERYENTYEFASEDYYSSKGIYLQCVDVQSFVLMRSNDFSVINLLDLYSNKIYETIEDVLPEEESAVLIAMLFGDKSGIENSTKELLYRAGIGHMMAVSGAHLAIISILVSEVLKMFRVGRYPKLVLQVLIILTFTVMSGMSISVIRSAIMILILQVSSLFKRRYDLLNSLGLAVLLLTAFTPYVVRDASFLLSVAGVFGVGVVAPAIIKEFENYFKLIAPVKSLIMSFTASIVILPVSMIFFDETSVVSPISNLLLLPLCTIALVLVVLVAITACVPILAVPLLTISGICCKLIIIISEYIGKQKWACIPLGFNWLKVFFIVISALVIFLYFISKDALVIFFLSIFALSLSMYTINLNKAIEDENIIIAVIGDKNASSLVIHNSNTACIVDLNSGGECAKSVKKYLCRNGIYDIDSVILSVDSLTSEPVYIEEMGLFDIDSVLVPKGQYMLGDTSALGKITCRYEPKKGTVKMRGYDIEFRKDNQVRIIFNDVSVDAVNSNKSYSFGSDEVFIAYAGTDQQDVSSNIYIACNSEAQVCTYKERQVFIGKCVELEVTPEGHISAEVLFDGDNN